jgi:hypothetical protein
MPTRQRDHDARGAPETLFYLIVYYLLRVLESTVHVAIAPFVAHILEIFHRPCLGISVNHKDTSLRTCFKTCGACHSCGARRRNPLMCPLTLRGYSPPFLELAPSGLVCGCSKSFLTILPRDRAPCSAGAHDVFKTASKWSRAVTEVLHCTGN